MEIHVGYVCFSMNSLQKKIKSNGFHDVLRAFHHFRLFHKCCVQLRLHHICMSVLANHPTLLEEHVLRAS